MNLSIILMNIGTWTLAIASLPQMWSIWKNRYNLKGYSRWGSFLLMLGLLFIDSSFLLMGDFISMTAGLIQVIMWGMATYYTKGVKK